MVNMHRVAVPIVDSEVLLLVKQMRQDFKVSGKVRDRKYHLKTYKQCFLHDDAMKWLMGQVAVLEKGPDGTRVSPIVRNIDALEQKAAQVGNLLVDAGYVSHVVDQHRFKPNRKDSLFFKFENNIIDCDLKHYHGPF